MKCKEVGNTASNAEKNINIRMIQSANSIPYYPG